MHLYSWTHSYVRLQCTYACGVQYYVAFAMQVYNNISTYNKMHAHVQLVYQTSYVCIINTGILYARASMAIYASITKTAIQRVVCMPISFNGPNVPVVNIYNTMCLPNRYHFDLPPPHTIYTQNADNLLYCLLLLRFGLHSQHSTCIFAPHRAF